jgi:hypothetical protein
MGGLVRVNSARGKGTRIEVDVPLQDVPNAEEIETRTLQVVGAESAAPIAGSAGRRSEFRLKRSRLARRGAAAAPHPETA